MEKTKQKKGGFSSGIGFVLAAAGSAIGLGNLWAFPYKTAENGGAAFVFIYVACVLLIGFATMICEIFIGRRAQANPISAYKKVSPRLGWMGLIAIVVPLIITFYYSVLGGYTVSFTVSSISGNAGKLTEFASQEWRAILFTLIFIVLALIVVMAGVKSGIEKASKVLMPLLFMLLIAVVIFVLFLGEGVKEGLEYYLVPDFSKISWDSVLAGLGQAFYSLSLGMGAMIVYGSYTGKEINVVKSTTMICVFDSLIALLAGLAIFPAVFHFASIENVDLSNLNLNGIMLMFETLPKVFESIGPIGNAIELTFFAMVTIAAITSVISIMEVTCQFVIQKFKLSRKVTTPIVALLTFAVSIPVSLSLGKLLCGSSQMQIFGMDLLSFFDTVTNTVMMPVCAFLSCITVGWFIGGKNAVAELEADGNKLGFIKRIFPFMVKFIVPALIMIIEVFGVISLIFPSGKFDANGLYVALFAYALIGVMIAIYFIFLKKTNTGCNADEVD